MGKRFCVLIVDDEADIRDSIGMTLEAIVDDVEVIFAEDGEDGLRKLKEHKVDLIMSDYKMPNMDGVEFLSKAKDLYPDVPRIMLTAYPDPKLAVQAVRDAGVGLFIAKPFDPAYIGELLRAFAPQDGRPRS